MTIAANIRYTYAWYSVIGMQHKGVYLGKKWLCTVGINATNENSNNKKKIFSHDEPTN